MRDDGIFPRFFDGLDALPIVPWDVRVSFPLPTDPSDLSDVVSMLESELGDLVEATRATHFEMTGPLTWVFRVSTDQVTKSFIVLEYLFKELLGGPKGAIDITPHCSPVKTIQRTEPLSVGRP